jgi:hypothetical protein
MRTRKNLPGKFAVAVLLFFAGTCFADALLMTLSVQSTRVQWQDEFVLTLEIYGAPSATPPAVTIDGLDQFQLKSIGKNLLQVPLGKTAKWILTYNLTAHQDGTFKLGPASATVNGRRFLSNTLFVTVEAPTNPAPRPAPAGPLVHSAAEIGDRVRVVMEAPHYRLYRSEGVPVTLRLLSQLPVENLRFEDEADFPGFVKYDFPFSTQPKAQWVTIGKDKYASYELQKFLVFPLKEGKLQIPPVHCQLKVRSPSGAYEAADLVMDVERGSNSIAFQVLPVPLSSVVGNFGMKNQILADGPRSKLVRIIIEGDGQLTTFDFPEIPGSGYATRIVDSATDSKIQGERLKSRKSLDLEVTPLPRTTNVVLPEISIRQFDPSTATLSSLRLPALPLRFMAEQIAGRRPAPVPATADAAMLVVISVAGFAALLFLTVWLRPQAPAKKPVRLSRFFHRANPSLRISRTAAQGLYRKIVTEIAGTEERSVLLIDTLKQHLPESEWIPASRAFKRLEAAAFSTSAEPLTYRELRTACQRVEKQWQS